MRALILLASLSAPTLAQTIDFGLVPGVGEPDEGLAIGDQFNVAPHFVQFRRVGPNGVHLPATIAKLGPKVRGYPSETNSAAFLGVSHDDLCDGNGDGNTTRNFEADMPADNLPYDPGCYFLTDDGLHGPNSLDVQDLIVRYTVPVMEASGYILDIDRGDSFMVHARDANGVDVAAPVPLVPGADPNGKATYWGFRASAPIHSILIHYDSRTGTSKGIAFDEFSPATICPSQVTHRGGGTPGSGGAVPALSLSCPSVGQSGEIDVFNGTGGMHGCLAIALTPTTRRLHCAVAPGGAEFLIDPQFVFPHVLAGSVGAPGLGTFRLSYGPGAIPAILRNQTVYVQAGYCDPGAACRGVALTEIVAVTIR